VIKCWDNSEEVCPMVARTKPTQVSATSRPTFCIQINRRQPWIRHEAGDEDNNSLLLKHGSATALFGNYDIYRTSLRLTLAEPRSRGCCWLAAGFHPIYNVFRHAHGRGGSKQTINITWNVAGIVLSSCPCKTSCFRLA